MMIRIMTTNPLCGTTESSCDNSVKDFPAAEMCEHESEEERRYLLSKSDFDDLVWGLSLSKQKSTVRF